MLIFQSKAATAASQRHKLEHNFGNGPSTVWFGPDLMPPRGMAPATATAHQYLQAASPEFVTPAKRGRGGWALGWKVNCQMTQLMLRSRKKATRTHPHTGQRRRRLNLKINVRQLNV